MATARSGGPGGLAVPAGTAFRFATLVGIAVAVTLFVADLFSETSVADRGLARLRCQVVSGVYSSASNRPDPDEGKWREYHRCLDALRGDQVLWLAGGVALLGLVSWALYLAQPAWRIRRGRLVALRDVPDLCARVGGSLVRLSRTAGLARVPEFRLDPRATRAGGVAFGTHRRPVVCLDVGLVLLHERDRPAFEAVVLHELAHLRHRDVPMTYATIAVWRAVLLVAVLPATVGFARPLLTGSPLRGPSDWLTLLWLPVLVLLAYAARVSVLRAREHHADVLVARWTGEADPYRTLPEVRAPRFGTHPGRAARLAATADPRVLLRPGFAEFFLGAVAWQVLTSTLGLGLSGLWLRSGGPGPPLVKAGWAVGVGVLVCLAAWRGAAYLAAGGDRRRVFLAPGLGIGVGLAAGTLLVPGAFAAPNGFQLSPVSVVLRVAGVGVAVLVCAWAGRCAVLLGGRVRGVGGAAVAAAVLVVCWGCLGWLPTAHGFAPVWATTLSPGLDRLAELAGGGLDSAVLGVVTLTFVTNADAVATTAVLALVWLVPAVLAGPVRAAFTAGAAGVACGAVAAVAVTWVKGASTPEAALVRVAWQLAAVALVQVAVAFAARRAGVVAGLVSAWLAGVGGCAAVWVTHWSGGTVDAVPARQPLQVLAVTAVAAGLLAAAVPRAADRPHPVIRRAPRLLLVPAVLVTVVAVLVHPTAPSAVALLPPEPTTADVDLDRALAIWASAGGVALLGDVVQAQGRSFAGMAERADRPAVVALCREQLERVRTARGFPAPPTQAARDHWNTGLDASRAAAERCVRAFSAPTGDPNPAAEQFEKARGELTALLRLLPGGAEAPVPPDPPVTTTVPPPPVDLATLLLTPADLPPGFAELPPSPPSETTYDRPECRTDVAAEGPLVPDGTVTRTYKRPDGMLITHSLTRYPSDPAVVLTALADYYSACAAYTVHTEYLSIDLTVRVVAASPLAVDTTFDGGALVRFSHTVHVVEGNVLSVVAFSDTRVPQPSFMDPILAAAAAK